MMARALGLGVVSNRMPIVSFRVEAVQDSPFESHPSVRVVVLGSASLQTR